MDREMLFRQLNQRYTSKREMISRIPLGMQPDALWQELLNQRRSGSTILPLFNHKGQPYWYVTTDKMVAASEKIVETLFENEVDFDPYSNMIPVSTLEEVFYTSYVEGAQISIQDAMDFLTGGQPPRDIEEQMITNNRMVGSVAGSQLYRSIDIDYLTELAAYLTDGLDQGGQEFRMTDEVDMAAVTGEHFEFSAPQTIPDRLDELCAFLESGSVHPLIKAAAAQAYMMILRPFPEGNERLGRLLSSIILIRAGYTFFSEISLSALIARKSYGYYEAITNILREEHGGDLTYFIDYFLELLSRAVDERKLRLRQETEENRRAEMALAKTALAPPSPPGDIRPQSEEFQSRTLVNPSPSLSTSRVINPQPSEADWVTNWTTEPSYEETLPDLSGFQSVPMPIEAEPDPAPEPAAFESPTDVLHYYAQRTDKVIGQLAGFLLRGIEKGQTRFSCAEMFDALNLQPQQLSSSIFNLKEKGAIRRVTDNGNKYYQICSEEDFADKRKADESPEGRYDPALLEQIEILQNSNSSKDKRIGAYLTRGLGKGVIAISDYETYGDESKWMSDMQLARQLGLVDKVSATRYKISKRLKSGPPLLSKGQKKFITEVYESFGEASFSLGMLTATLDYTDAHISGYLHKFTLLKILDCKKEDVNRYQFLITPDMYPECFETAA